MLLCHPIASASPFIPHRHRHPNNQQIIVTQHLLSSLTLNGAKTPPDQPFVQHIIIILILVFLDFAVCICFALQLSLSSCLVLSHHAFTTAYHIPTCFHCLIHFSFTIASPVHRLPMNKLAPI